MSIALATKGIICVIGRTSSIPTSVCVPVCEFEVSSYGEKHMRGKELKPKIRGEEYFLAVPICDPVCVISIIIRGFGGGEIITRGFGKYESVPIGEPDGTSQKYGEKHIKVKEIKPTMRAEEI